MGALNDLTGQKFGRLTVIRRDGSDKFGKPMWLCECDCGSITSVGSRLLIIGRVRSCGCLRIETTTANRSTHGLSKTKTHNEWCGMKQRCYNPKSKRYEHYGGRGIQVCDSWKNDFTKFHNDVAKLPHFNEPGYTLDRINNDGDYEPMNVRWANDVIQQNNKRTNHRLTYNGETHTIAEWARLTDIPYDRIRHRLNRGWSVERTLGTLTKERPGSKLD